MKAKFIMAALAVAAGTVLTGPAGATAAPDRTVTIDGSWGPVTLSLRTFKHAVAEVRAAADPQAKLLTLPADQQAAVAYNFVPMQVTGLALGPCTGGDPDECDHVAPPAEQPEVVVDQPPPPPPVPTEYCGIKNNGYAQTDLVGFTLYEFWQHAYRCWNGTLVKGAYADSDYDVRGPFWDCDTSEVPAMPKNTTMPPADSPTSQVSSIGKCHTTLHFVIFNRTFETPGQTTTPKIVIQLHADGGAEVVKMG